MSRILISLVVAAVVYPIVGLAGCLVRSGSVTSNDVLNQTPQYYQFWYGAPLDAFSTEAVYASLFVVVVVLALLASEFFNTSAILRFLIGVGFLVMFGFLGKFIVDGMNIKGRLASLFNINQGVFAARPDNSPATVLKADKVTKGRTAAEKVYEFVLPANRWIETDIQISPNQEVMVHHFNSNDQVTVVLGGLQDNRLQKAGTILPLFTSKNCSKDAGVRAKVQYTCVQLTNPGRIRLFATNSVRVGVAVKNR